MGKHTLNLSSTIGLQNLGGNAPYILGLHQYPSETHSQLVVMLQTKCNATYARLAAAARKVAASKRSLKSRLLLLTTHSMQCIFDYCSHCNRISLVQKNMINLTVPKNGYGLIQLFILSSWHTLYDHDALHPYLAQSDNITCSPATM